MNIDLVNQILVMVLFAVSLNLILGYTGQPTIAHAAFGAVGGFTAGLLSIHLGVPFLPGLVLAFVAAYVVGAVASLPALVLGSDWVILLTLATAYIVNQLISTVPALGGGYNVNGVHKISLFGHEFTDPSQIFWIFLVIALVVLAVCWRLGESPYGRVLKGLREDEVATRSLGKNTTRFKSSVFSLTAGVAGLAGACLVYYYSSANPLFFSLNQSIAMMSMVIIGGAGNFWGAILGAILIQGSTPFLQNVVNIAPEHATFVQQVFYGLALVLLSIFRPAGLLRERPGSSVRRAARRALAVRAKAAVAPQPEGPVLDGRGHDGAALAESREPVAALAAVAGPSSGSAGVTGGDAPPPADAGSGGIGGGSGPDGAAGFIRDDAEAARRDGRVVLRVSGLKKRFGGIVAVNGVDLELVQGRITALIGPNGAGKSTLFGLWTGFIPPDEGEVELDGTSVVGMRPDHVLHRGMVRSFQDTRLFQNLTVLENVMMAAPEQSGETLRHLLFNPVRVRRDDTRALEIALGHLETVGMLEKAHEVVGNLGHGDQKLAAIARVLATEAPVMLLDEPTSGVDPLWVDRVAAVVRRLPTLGRTVCIVEHNLAFLEKLNAFCYFLEMGRVRSSGSLSELMADEELRHAYFGV
jgi:branched-chain amino acid transport system permease protein